MNVKLVVIGGNKGGLEIPVSTPRFLIGRSERCHIRPQSKLVGGLHCQITVDGDSLLLEDFGGAIGTFVNGQKVQQRCRLQQSDRIKIATIEFEVRVSVTEPAAPRRQVGRAPTATHDISIAATTTDPEADILNWVKQEEESHSSRPKVVTLQYPRSEERPADPIAVATTVHAAREKVIELDGIDLLLLSLIGPLALIVLSSVPTFWIWQGCGALVVLAVLASACTVRGVPSTCGGMPPSSNSALSPPSRRHILLHHSDPSLSTTLNELGEVPRRGTSDPSSLQQVRLEAMHATTGILVALVLGLMLPARWIWQVGAVSLLVGLCLAAAIRARRLTGDKLDSTNMALIIASGLVAILIVAVSLLLSSTLWMQFSGAGGVVLAIAMVGFRRKRPTSQKSERILLRLTTVGSLLVVFFGFLFPVPTWWPDWLNLREWPYWLTWSTMEQCWSWFRLQVLRNWWYNTSLRWGMAVFWAVLVVVLLVVRARREAAR